MSFSLRCEPTMSQTQIQAQRSAVPEIFWAKEFYMRSAPPQFKNRDSFYYAMLDWSKETVRGRSLFTAYQPATSDAVRDHRVFNRILLYLGRSKQDWFCMGNDISTRNERNCTLSPLYEDYTHLIVRDEQIVKWLDSGFLAQAVQYHS